MANQDRPNGLVPHGQVLRVTEYVAGAACYPGDPLALAADGKVDPSAGDALIGVCASYAAADGDKVQVWDHPDQRFTIQSNDATITAQSFVGGNYDVVVGTPSTTYKMSRAELDGDTADATAATNPLKVLDLAKEVGNDFGGNALLIVKINNHQLSGGTGSAGVV